ncbi:hypothetical protein SAMN06295905_1342 [Devosia lucknowensis]|uniref:Uncharacterized protein n=1 Tax=Devosia lucknowensis TaxID=1096929 RepID=A0A1Y6EXZ9_9HYPH|nr:hypothetical protein SAMN06295905_1342 [Devosia lucknowensis]
MVQKLEDIVELGDLIRLDFKPGDKAVLMASRCISHEQGRRIHEAWERYAPGVPLLVLDDGMKLGLIREGD